jgi:hypothetical protein
MSWKPAPFPAPLTTATESPGYSGLVPKPKALVAGTPTTEAVAAAVAVRALAPSPAGQTQVE